ncbi:ABC transporter permease [Desulfobaculum sp. SPO524]|uniref:ABC transporter permease n=1 Tax=Desulfobaculum sp. SPO524 TaxID=3378071 RepID=UPI0038524004
MSSGKAQWGETLLKLSPLLIPFLALFGGGLVMAVGQSFGLWVPIAPDSALAGYRALLSEHVLRSALLSLWVGLASASLSVALGAVLAYLFWRLPPHLERWAVVAKVPLILPHIAVAFITLIFWSTSGVLSSLAYHLGLVDGMDAFPSLMYDATGTGMILAYVFKSTPFVIILAMAMLRRLEPQLVETATMLGAGEVTVFWRLVLPRITSALNTAFIILFLYAFGAFDIPFLLSGSSPGMLSIEVFNLYFRRDLANRPTAMAILVCMFLFSLAFIVLYTRTARRMAHRERKL